MVLEERHLARLDALVGLEAQVVLHALGEPHEPGLIRPLEEALEDEDGHRQAGERHRHPPGVGAAGEPRDPGGGRAAQRVDHPADQQRRHQVEDLVENRGAAGQPEAPAVAAQLAEQPRHRPRRLGRAGGRGRG